MSKATQAGRRAYSAARKNGYSVKASLKKYARAYSAVACRFKNRKEYMKKYRKTWKESDFSRLKHRDSNSRMHLRKATKIKKLISGGWPDAGRIEQKIGQGFVTPNQWLRAAWAEKQGTAFELLFARTQEEALHKSKCEKMSFQDYAQKLGMLKEWNKLVRLFKDSAA
jgi:hypothetical protein